MKVSLYLLVLFTVVLNACKNNKSLSKELICTQLRSATAIAEDSIPKAAAEKRTLWPHQRDMPLTLIVKFMNGSEFQRNKVIQYAQLWKQASVAGWNNKYKVRFSFVPDTYPAGARTDIRIAFRPGGSSSYVGSDCRNVPQDMATTTFGWVDEYHAEIEIQQVILHELGHALGLIHEHQNPTAKIPWNPDAVYRYYRDTQQPPWTPKMVDDNIFKLYDASATNFTKFDSLSIMCYAIPPSITYGGYSTPWNSNLSVTDKQFIKRIYPYDPCIPNETCCFDRRGRRIPCP